MQRGICKLCLIDADLCSSHYLCRALYRLSRTNGDDPIMSSSLFILPTDLQVQDYVFCRECERRFDEGGENYAMRLVNRKTEFRLLDVIRATPRRHSEGEFTVYRADDMNIDTQALAYFALSVIWRGSVHRWTLNAARLKLLDLGDHQEPIRRFLHGDELMPSNLCVKVSVATDWASQNCSMFPRLNPDQKDASAFTFMARGIWFDVVLGDPLPTYANDSCCVRGTDKLLFVGDFDRFVTWEHNYAKRTAEIDSRLRTGCETN
jgi:hypothetical protein